jgi:hypothetical protein
MAKLREAEWRGKLMYMLDRTAWVTTDDMRARLSVDRRADVGGWVQAPEGNTAPIYYFGKDGAADRVIYSADIQHGAVANVKTYPKGEEPTLPALALKMAHALAAARAEMARHADWKPCTPAKFNTVVLPPQANGVISVYFLTPQTETGIIPFGGHYEVDIAGDGQVAFSRAFTRGCIALSANAPPGSKPAMLMITHLLDPVPTEIHVFQQLASGVPLIVMVGPKTYWAVVEGRIGRAGPEGQK